MFINPKTAIEQGWIKGLKDPAKQVQPNAIDFTLDKVFLVDSKFDALIGEERKRMRTLTEAELDITTNTWKLQGQSVYDGTSSVYVSVPEGVAALVYTRSTLARNGVFLVSGLYDSGYQGQIGFTMYTIGGLTYIDVGTRVGQIAFVKSESAGVYAGQYNHAEGTHYADNSSFAKELAFGEKSEAAKSLESATTINADYVGKPAGQQNFI